MRQLLCLWISWKGMLGRKSDFYSAVCQFGKETVSETDMQRVLVCG